MAKKAMVNCDVLIVGAGPAGLSTAWHLRDSGKTVRLVEVTGYVGGLTKTREERGFRFDSVIHVFHLRDNSIKQWIVDDLFKGKLPCLDRVCRVWSSGVYTRYPFQANTYGLPEKVASDCLEEYLKVLKHPPKKKVRTAEDFIYKHFGKGFARHFMIPYNNKLWGVHPKYLTAKWGERFVPIPKKEDVLAGAKPNPDRNLGYNSSFFYPVRGAGELAERIHAALPPHTVEFDVALRSVDLEKKIATLSTGERVRYQHLVSTIPLPELVRSVQKPSFALAKNAKLLKCRPLPYLDIALNVPARQEYHWCYVPSPKVPFYRVTIYSNLSSLNAPERKSSLCVELASRRYNKKMLPKILDGLREMGLIKDKTDIQFVSPKFIKYAYVIYDQNHSKVVPIILKTLTKNRVHSTGRWGVWNYSSTEDALIMGRETAQKILKL
ncbi:MAG: FAD-dependent oxidoreductase [Candidatus Zambryskibacteria bacterium]|nr:FAD-dependent oxidoreductase [Candidatus Zambryskibacteria bacterium]